VNVDTYSTGLIEDDAQLESIIRKVFPLTPAGIIRSLKLKYPKQNGWSYQDTAAYGHFGRPSFPWEKTDKVAKLKESARKLLKKKRK
jgi:S-adenosylmethionine synthetase